MRRSSPTRQFSEAALIIHLTDGVSSLAPKFGLVHTTSPSLQAVNQEALLHSAQIMGPITPETRLQMLS